MLLVKQKEHWSATHTHEHLEAAIFELELAQSMTLQGCTASLLLSMIDTKRYNDRYRETVLSTSPGLNEKLRLLHSGTRPSSADAACLSAVAQTGYRCMILNNKQPCIGSADDDGHPL